MFARALATLILTAALATAALAQEHVRVGTQQSVDNGALFLADGRGYFKAEGLVVDLTAYASAGEVAQALATGATDLGLASFSASAVDLAGKGAIKAIAAQAREKADYEGNELVASNAAYAQGLHKFADLANRSLAIDALGSPSHYQFGQIARVAGFDAGTVTLKPLQSFDAVAAAVRKGEVDAAILPAQYARELLVATQAKLIGWCSEIDAAQLGALFAASAAIETRRDMLEKFLRAYRRGAADYAAAFLRHDRYGKRMSDATSRAAAQTIARYVYPGHAPEIAAASVEAGAVFVDPLARLDSDDIARQVAWYKAQGLLDAGVDARDLVDLSFPMNR
jgi:NitT/TauT family transport system substrate-binding protein